MGRQALKLLGLTALLYHKVFSYFGMIFDIKKYLVHTECTQGFLPPCLKNGLLEGIKIINSAHVIIVLYRV